MLYVRPSGFFKITCTLLVPLLVSACDTQDLSQSLKKATASVSSTVNTDASKDSKSSGSKSDPKLNPKNNKNPGPLGPVFLPPPTIATSPRPSVTPSRSPSPSPSATPSRSPSPSPSATPSRSPSPSPSATPSRSPSPSPSVSSTWPGSSSVRITGNDGRDTGNLSIPTRYFQKGQFYDYGTYSLDFTNQIILNLMNPNIVENDVLHPSCASPSPSPSPVISTCVENHINYVYITFCKTSDGVYCKGSLTAGQTVDFQAAQGALPINYLALGICINGYYRTYVMNTPAPQPPSYTTYDYSKRTGTLRFNQIPNSVNSTGAFELNNVRLEDVVLQNGLVTDPSRPILFLNATLTGVKLIGATDSCTH